MSNEIIERAAKALWDKYQSQSYVQYGTNEIMYGMKGIVTWEYINSDNVIPSVAEEYREMARIVVKSIRKPTPAMCEAGDKVPEGQCMGVWVGRDDIWQAMIDEILRN